MKPDQKHQNYSKEIRGIVTLIVLCTVLLPTASATEYILSASSQDTYGQGIRYNGTDPLVITLQDDVTIQSAGTTGIDSAAPVTIRSPADRTLKIVVQNGSEVLYGIRAPSVTVGSGNLDIAVLGGNTSGSGIAYGMVAETGDVVISGGSVSATVDTGCHKNKGIYALRHIRINGGSVSVTQHGGKNTFGIDGGAVETGDMDGGVIISGGRVVVHSSGGSERNVGIDSKFGEVDIRGTPVIVIAEDGSGRNQNYALNRNITRISGSPVLITSDGGDSFSVVSMGRLSLPVSFTPRSTTC